MSEVLVWAFVRKGGGLSAGQEDRKGGMGNGETTVGVTKL